MSYEHVTLIAAAAAVTDTCAATAACTAINGRAWLSEEELWVVCSVWAATLACKTLVL